MIMSIIGLGMKIIGGITNTQAAKATTRGVILSSVWGFLFSVILFIAWGVLEIVATFTFYTAPGGIEQMLAFSDSIYNLFWKVMGFSGMGAVAGNRLKEKDIKSARAENIKNKDTKERIINEKKKTTPPKKGGLELVRHYANDYTPGEMFYNGEHLGIYTLELPKENQSGVENAMGDTCIYEGSYRIEVQPHSFKRKKFSSTGVIRLFNVVGRSGILFHPANYLYQLRGCISPGLTTGKKSVFGSKKAMRKLVALINNNNIKEISIRKE